jgi:hypothetical protein
MTADTTRGSEDPLRGDPRSRRDARIAVLDAERAGRAVAAGPEVVASQVSGALPEGEAEIELRGVSKRFRARDEETLALADIDLGIRKQ